jgi:hypothetical protein
MDRTGVWMRLRVTGCAALALVLGCASQPVLYPNEQYQAAGEAGARADVEECRRLAKLHGADGGGAGGSVARDTATGAVIGGGAGAASGAAVGAIVGSAGRGAAAGAAGGAAWAATSALLRGMFRPRAERSDLEQAFVTRCLRERGYDVMGWK